MEIGKYYEVVAAETNEGELEFEKLKLIKKIDYKEKEIYVFEDQLGYEYAQYNHNNKNIDWDFVAEINEKFGY